MINSIKKIFFTLILCLIIGCDNNDDVQATPVTPTDGFIHNTMFYSTTNVYVAIDQLDRDNTGGIDYYTFFFTDGRITDTFGDVGIGYAHAFSDNTTKIVKLQVFESDNSNLTTNSIVAGNTYVASSSLTTNINSLGITNSGYSADSFVSYNLLTSGSNFGTENGIDFYHIAEGVGGWNFAGTVGPTITINAINIDNNTPTNSTINVDYTFMNTNGEIITGHYEGTLGIILD